MNSEIQPSITQEKLEYASRILKTIAHPVKLKILMILGENEPMDVTSLCEAVGDDCLISMMSHHLTKMKDNGILRSTKDGKQVFYSIVDRNILKIFNCIDECSVL